MSNLSEKQVQAIAHLATGMRKKDVAQKLDVTPETISNWLAKPDFYKELNQVKLDALKATRDQMQALATTAVQTFSHLMTDAQSDAVRLKAAHTVLETIGIINPASGVWGWGIDFSVISNTGSSEKDVNEQIEKILDSLRKED